MTFWRCHLNPKEYFRLKTVQTWKVFGLLSWKYERKLEEIEEIMKHKNVRGNCYNIAEFTIFPTLFFPQISFEKNEIKNEWMIRNCPLKSMSVKMWLRQQNKVKFCFANFIFFLIVSLSSVWITRKFSQAKFCRLQHKAWTIIPTISLIRSSKTGFVNLRDLN